MTKKELKENSKLIAQFDGWQHCGLGGNFKQCYQKVGDIRHIDDFNYHLSWDRLMPIVEKIETMDYGIKMCRKVVEVYVDSTKEVILKTKESCRIESLYKAVVEFINWYNKQENEEKRN